jgi:hypothetical protein
MTLPDNISELEAEPPTRPSDGSAPPVAAPLNLPDDFGATLDLIAERGVLEEDSAVIHARLELALQEVAAAEGHVVDLGVRDWPLKLSRALEAALHQELCDRERRALRSQYDELLAAGMSKEGVAAIAPVVVKVIGSVNPAFAVSSVAIYLGVFLLKTGLNYWCSVPR